MHKESDSSRVQYGYFSCGALNGSCFELIYSMWMSNLHCLECSFTWQTLHFCVIGYQIIAWIARDKPKVDLWLVHENSLCHAMIVLGLSPRLASYPVELSKVLIKHLGFEDYFQKSVKTVWKKDWCSSLSHFCLCKQVIYFKRSACRLIGRKAILERR